MQATVAPVDRHGDYSVTVTRVISDPLTVISDPVSRVSSRLG